jgi:hypothetical protein
MLDNHSMNQSLATLMHSLPGKKLRVLLTTLRRMIVIGKLGTWLALTLP